jgi:D-amino-acid dehydrogenase
MKWMLSKHSPLAINPRPQWDKIKFVARLFGQCNAQSYALNKSRMLRLADYSRHSLQQFRQQMDLDFDHQSKGTLQLFRTRKQLQAAQQDMAILDKLGIEYESLHVNGCVEAEPGLQDTRHKIVGGLRLPGDETGDCFQLTQSLARQCARLGVKFHYETEITRIHQQEQRIQKVTTTRGEFEADAYVMALGSFSTSLLKTLDIDSPVYPVQGYSITLPIAEGQAAPVSTLMDETYKVAITRLGSRIRVAGMAELDGFRQQLKQKRRQTLRHVVNDLFPGVANTAEDEFWTGLRPMTPDGTPIVGASGIDNLFLNTGHGTLGWTMSFGSARLLADIVSGKQPDIEYRDLSIARYGKSMRANPGTGDFVTVS